MARLQLDAFLDDDAMETPPIPSTAHPEGRVYRIPSPSAKDGLRLARLASLAVRANDEDPGAKVTEDDLASIDLDDAEERDLYRMALGSAYQEMLDDGVSWVRIQRLGRYMFFYFGMSPESAEQALRSGVLSGEAKAPNRATRRTAKKATSKSASRGSRGSSRTTTRAAAQD